MQAASVKGSPSSCWLWALHVEFMHSCYKKFDDDVMRTRYDSIKSHQSVLHLFVEGVCFNFYTAHLDVRINYWLAIAVTQIASGASLGAPEP